MQIGKMSCPDRKSKPSSQRRYIWINQRLRFLQNESSVVNKTAGCRRFPCPPALPLGSENTLIPIARA